MKSWKLLMLVSVCFLISIVVFGLSVGWRTVETPVSGVSIALELERKMSADVVSVTGVDSVLLAVHIKSRAKNFLFSSEISG